MRDIKLDRYADIDLSSGDMAITDSDYQHQEHILIAQKGTLKENPDRGVGLQDFLNDTELDVMLAETRSEFEKDGMRVNKLSFSEQSGDLKYDAKY